MKTLDWIQWLLERNWTVRCLVRIDCKQPFKFHRNLPDVWEWRSPEGISGNDYQSTNFDVLPPAVDRYILDNCDVVDKQDDLVVHVKWTVIESIRWRRSHE